MSWWLALLLEQLYQELQQTLNQTLTITMYIEVLQGFAVTPVITVPVATPTTNSYANTGLTSSTIYYYRVAAVDNAGNIGILSDEDSVQ